MLKYIPTVTGSGMCSENLICKSQKVSKRALNMLILKEQGYVDCYILIKLSHCCITVHSAVALTEEAQGRIKEIAANRSKPKTVF